MTRGAAANGGSEYMRVVRVGQLEGRDQAFVPNDEAILDGSVHEAAGSVQAFPGDDGVAGDDSAHPFLVNLG